MIYVLLSVFREYSAYVTADNATGFRDVFRAVVADCVEQYQDECGPLDSKWTDRITHDMESLEPVPVAKLKEFSYDLKIDVGNCTGIIYVQEVFLDKEEVISRYQPWVDELNQELDYAEEKLTVFDSGFFPSQQGYALDDLFK